MRIFILLKFFTSQKTQEKSLKFNFFRPGCSQQLHGIVMLMFRSKHNSTETKWNEVSLPAETLT